MRIVVIGAGFGGLAAAIRLQAQGHPKWREVELTLPELSSGWSYYPPMWREMKNCIAQKPRPAPIKVCSQQERILGFCK